jgi:hypothetical protein
MTRLPREPLEQVLEPYLEAESGDWRRFADMIERGEPLPEHARKMIADHLRGNSPPPKRRKRAQERIEADVCYRVFQCMDGGLSKYAAINEVSEVLKMEPETVKTYLKNWKRDWENIK